MTKLSNPQPLFIDGRGFLLDAGYLYVGTVNNNPETPANRVNLFWDKALSIPAAQPLRTLGGVIVNGQNPAYVFLAETDYSMTIKDADGNLVDYLPSATDTGGPAASYQPLDSDLSAIALLSTTAYGRGLLTLANQAALKSATGIPDCLPKTGGSVTGNILRVGAGVHPYFFDAAMSGGRIFITAVGAADPTSQPGDIWLTY